MENRIVLAENLEARAPLVAVVCLSAALAAACSASATGGNLTDGSIVDATSCAPQPVTAPAPAWVPPHPLHGNVCSPQDGAAIVSCLLLGQSCNVPVSLACHVCAVSGDTSATSAALIVHDPGSGKAAELNIAGCVGAASGDPSSAGCGARLAVKEWCFASACAACPDPASSQACTSQAAAGVCATANAEAQCAAPYLAECVQGTTQLEIAFNLVKVFCGP
jgi:hypothetical protein